MGQATTREGEDIQKRASSGMTLGAQNKQYLGQAPGEGQTHEEEVKMAHADQREARNESDDEANQW